MGVQPVRLACGCGQTAHSPTLAAHDHQLLGSGDWGDCLAGDPNLSIATLKLTVSQGSGAFEAQAEVDISQTIIPSASLFCETYTKIGSLTRS